MRVNSLSCIGIYIQHCDPLIHAGLVAAIAADVGLSVRGEHPVDEASDYSFHRVEGADVFISDFNTAIKFIEAKRQRSEPSATAVLIASGADHEVQIRTALAKGVLGYLVAGCSLVELATAIRTIARGRHFVSQQVSQRMAEGLAAKRLSAREVDVLRSLSDGMCNKDIARSLGVTLGTIKTHMRSIFEKLGVNSRTRALVVATRRGILERGRVVDVDMKSHEPFEFDLPSQPWRMQSRDVEVDHVA